MQSFHGQLAIAFWRWTDGLRLLKTLSTVVNRHKSDTRVDITQAFAIFFIPMLHIHSSNHGYALCNHKSLRNSPRRIPKLNIQSSRAFLVSYMKRFINVPLKKKQHPARARDITWENTIKEVMRGLHAARHLLINQPAADPRNPFVEHTKQ